ncbi:hypothetical protein PQE70_gp021 [Bacillus phage vB_BanS_Nate]|uniref:Uncharacterized protein n=1 Tax=Bacillus phage vB_BanS_Nate TaxID=2894788 RepID=A0AAE9CE48_9CAUD|nr:hypothetical protein PQE70_gp021 [Bacillus phage vB_BanS_Nate]UGO50874.1 hypothetical protein NATE_21 [Bacillus phage vB_BanS_Nate]
MTKQKRTFTVIRKWAVAKGYTVEESWAYGDRPAIEIKVNEKLSFKAEMRSSTIYQSIRGQRGDAGGLYITEKIAREEGEPYRRNYAFHKLSQREAIESMEHDVKDMIKREAQRKERGANENK